MKETLEDIVAELMLAWNAGDGEGFASAFAEDAAQVNIFGMQLQGRTAIAEQHDRIFKTTYRGSTNNIEIVNVREIAPDVQLARISSVVSVPRGPMSGEVRTIGSLVLRRAHDSGWEILLFHNTRVGAPP